MKASERLRELSVHITENAYGRAMDGTWPLLENSLPLIADVVQRAEERVDKEWADFAEYGMPEEGELPPHTPLSEALLKLERGLRGD